MDNNNIHIIQQDLAKSTRLVDYCIGIFHQIPTRNRAKKAIKKKLLLVNGEAAEESRWLKKGDQIELLEADDSPQKIFPLEMDVVFEDEHLAVINKPAGYPVSGNRFKTIANALLHNIQLSQKEDRLLQPKTLHRLDAPTSGLLLVAKTVQAHIHLSQQFQNRTIQKTYQAIVKGKPDNQNIDFPIEEQEALSSLELVKTIPSLHNEFISLVKLRPKTGRTHQLRIHCTQIGHPIIGDKMYDKEPTLNDKGLFLAAIALEFTHPVSEEVISLKIDAPHKFESLLEREERRWHKFK